MPRVDPVQQCCNTLELIVVIARLCLYLVWQRPYVTVHWTVWWLMMMYIDDDVQ